MRLSLPLIQRKRLSIILMTLCFSCCKNALAQAPDLIWMSRFNIELCGISNKPTLEPCIINTGAITHKDHLLWATIDMPIPGWDYYPVQPRTNYGIGLRYNFTSNYMGGIYLYLDQMIKHPTMKSNSFLKKRSVEAASLSDINWASLFALDGASFFNVGIELHTLSYGLGSNIYFSDARLPFTENFFSQLISIYKGGIDCYIAHNVKYFPFLGHVSQRLKSPPAVWAGLFSHFIQGKDRIPFDTHVSGIVLGFQYEIKDIQFENKIGYDNARGTFISISAQTGFFTPLLNKNIKDLIQPKLRRHLLPGLYLKNTLGHYMMEVDRKLGGPEIRYLKDIQKRFKDPNKGIESYIYLWKSLKVNERYGFYELAKGQGDFSKLPVELRLNILSQYDFGFNNKHCNEHTYIRLFEKLSTLSQERQTFFQWLLSKKSPAAHLLTAPTFENYLIKNGLTS